MDAVETETIDRNKEKTSVVFGFPLAVNARHEYSLQEEEEEEEEVEETKAIDEEPLAGRNPLLIHPAALLLPGWSATG